MDIKDQLKIRLDLINTQIEIYKKNAIENIEKEEMIPATSNVLMMRDLKEQQGLIKRLLEKEEWLRMNNTTAETRRESNEKIDKKARENQVLDILSDGKERTARQVAFEMQQRGFTNTAERNNASPRLTSLLEQRKVIVVGKEIDNITGKKVAVFKIA